MFLCHPPTKIPMSLFKTLSNKMPLILFGLIASILVCGHLLPIGLKSGLYATSMSIKGLIVGVLPIIIFGLLFSAAVLMAKKATWIVGLILGPVCLSTFVAVFLARFVGLGLYNMDLSLSLPPVMTPLTPLWHWELDAWVSNSMVMMSAVFSGLMGAFFMPETDWISGGLQPFVRAAYSPCRVSRSRPASRPLRSNRHRRQSHRYERER